MDIPRIFFDSNAGPPGGGRYGLWFDNSRTDLAKIPGGPTVGMRIVIYMPGELEMQATLAFDAEWGWTAKPIPGTVQYLNE